MCLHSVAAQENEVLGAPLREDDMAIAGAPAKQHPRSGKSTAAVIDPDVAATVEAPRSTMTGKGTLSSAAAAASAAKNGGSARVSQPPPLPPLTGESTTTMAKVAAVGEKAIPAGANGVAVNGGGKLATTISRPLAPINETTAAAAADPSAVEQRKPQTASADAEIGRGEKAGEASCSAATRSSREAANGGGGGDDDHEQPGLIALKGASFRWTSGKAEDEHAKIFRSLVEAPAGKRKVCIAGRG